MSADIVHIRDFKRREEREAADVRLATRVGMAELIAESVCELPNVWPDFQHSTANTIFKDGLPVGYIDTAPSEMPPVQPYFAPEKDPA